MQQEVTSAGQTFRETLETLESARSDEATTKARRQHDLSQLALRMNGERVAFVRSGEQLFTEQLAPEELRTEFARSAPGLGVRLSAAQPETY